MESGVEFVAVDNPHANKLTIHILAAVAQHEREMISARTKAALQAAKKRGQRLGNPGIAEAAKLGTSAMSARLAVAYGRMCRLEQSCTLSPAQASPSHDD